MHIGGKPGLRSRHRVDGMGHDEGGSTWGDGLTIAWEAATVQDVIRAARDRLEFQQSTQCFTYFPPTPERAAAIDHLAEALKLLGG